MGRFLIIIAIILAIPILVASCIWTAPDRYPAAAYRACLFDMLHPAVQDAYVGFTLANMIWLACATYEWTKVAAYQLSVFAGYGPQFLGFFLATIFSWVLLLKQYVATAAVQGLDMIHDAKTVLSEIFNASLQLRSRLEVMFNSTLAYSVIGLLVLPVVVELCIISIVVLKIFCFVVKMLYHAGRRVHWIRAVLLVLAGLFGYVGYLWSKIV